MKQEDLRAARLIEAKRRWIEDETPRREVAHLADLYESNWTPPRYVVVPVEAVRKLRNAFHQTRLTSDVSVNANALGDVLDYFRAMLAARPAGEGKP